MEGCGRASEGAEGESSILSILLRFPPGYFLFPYSRLPFKTPKWEVSGMQTV